MKTSTENHAPTTEPLEQRVQFLETMVASLLHELSAKPGCEGLRRYFEQQRAVKPISVESDGYRLTPKPIP